MIMRAKYSGNNLKKLEKGLSLHVINTLVIVHNKLEIFCIFFWNIIGIWYLFQSGFLGQILGENNEKNETAVNFIFWIDQFDMIMYHNLFF